MNKLKSFAKKFLALEKKLSNKLENIIVQRTEKIRLKQYNGQEISKELEEKIRKEVMLKLSMILVFIFFLVYMFLTVVIGVSK